jgi:ferredoxin-type protein NapH
MIIIALLLFPVVLNYLSPYIIIHGASEGIINGSLIVFAGMFISSLFVGRLWCGWLCPGAGLGEICFAVNSRPARGGRLDWIKWGIWIPWIGIIAALAIAVGGYSRIDFLHLTESGISVVEPMAYIIYYMVVGLIVILSLTLGRRAFCHYACWMAPFMIIGRKIRNLARWPSLRLRSDTARCISCGKCNTACPMSLDVQGMVTTGSMEHTECILCGNCVDICPKEVIAFTFSAGR